MAARLLAALAVVFGVSLLVFLLVHAVPGDPVDAMLGEYASVADRDALGRALGLDRPLVTQWFDFLGGLLRGDLGHSLQGGEAVATLVASRFRMTLLLAVAAALVALLVGLPLGILAARRAGSRYDSAAAALAVLGMALPSFVLGPLLMLVFAVGLGWLPIGGADGPRALVLPALTLGLGMAGLIARMTRAALLDVLGERFVLAARARGLGEARVLLNHACRAAALPVLTTAALQVGSLLGGAVITEVVFGWPGIGQLVVEAIQRRDYPVVQGCVLVISLAYVLLNTLTDLLYLALDPRLRSA